MNQCRGGGGTRASLHSDTVEDLIRISVGGGHYSIPSFRHSGRSDKNQCRGGGGGTRASLHSDTVEDLI